MKKQEGNPIENITWSEMGKQSTQTKKILCDIPERVKGFDKSVGK